LKVHPDKLTRKSEFQLGYRIGRKYWDRYFVIYVRANNSPTTRLGITMSKKVGGSIKRNRVRRLVRESFRHLKSQLRLGMDVIVVGRRVATGLKCQQAQASLCRLFRRARLVS